MWDSVFKVSDSVFKVSSSISSGGLMELDPSQKKKKKRVPLVQKDFKELDFGKTEFHVAFFNGERNINGVHHGKNHTKLNYLKIEFYTKLEF